MTYHVHICCVGRNTDPCMAMTRSDIPIDCVYLVCANTDAYEKVDPELNRALKDSESKVHTLLHDSGISEINTVRVDSWDFRGVIDKILDIAAEVDGCHPDAKYHINFTSGTHVMAGAVSCAAFYIGADLYYVLKRDEHQGVTAENEVQRFDIPFIPDVQRLKRDTRRVLFLLDENKPTSNRALMSEMTDSSPSKLGYHTKVLREYGLIEQSRRGKEVSWRLTYSGMVARRILQRPVRRSSIQN